MKTKRSHRDREELWASVNRALDEGLDPLEQAQLREELREQPDVHQAVLRLRARLAMLSPGPRPAVAPRREFSTRPSTSWHLAAGLAAAALMALAVPAPEREGRSAAPPTPASEILASSVEVEHYIPSAPQPIRIDRSATRVVAWTLPGEGRNGEER